MAEDKRPDGKGFPMLSETTRNIPYAVIFRQLALRLLRRLPAPMGEGDFYTAPDGTVYPLLSTEDAIISLLQKLPDKLRERRDNKTRNHEAVASHACLSRLEDALHSAGREEQRVIFFFAPHPVIDRINDGYAQRIATVDEVFGKDSLRVYVCEAEDTPEEHAPQAFCVDERCYYLRYRQGSTVQLDMLCAMANQAAFLYVHSVLRIFLPLFRRLTPPILLDLHGSVPEEAQMNGDVRQFFQQSANEEYAVHHAKHFIFITAAQKHQLEEKYSPATLPGFVLPAFSRDFPPPEETAPALLRREGTPVVIYCGGAQRWQMVDTMLQAMRRQNRYVYRIYTQDPNTFREYCRQLALEDVSIRYVPQKDLAGEYSQAHYGFVLREDMTVNHVAGPTKLTEYCTQGVVPILHTPHIGDFPSMGLRYLPLNDFLAGNLPSEEQRQAMALANLAVAQKMAALYRAGLEKLAALNLGP